MCNRNHHNRRSGMKKKKTQKHHNHDHPRHSHRHHQHHQHRHDHHHHNRHHHHRYHRHHHHAVCLRCHLHTVLLHLLVSGVCFMSGDASGGIAMAAGSEYHHPSPEFFLSIGRGHRPMLRSWLCRDLPRQGSSRHPGMFPCSGTDSCAAWVDFSVLAVWSLGEAFVCSRLQKVPIIFIGLSS